MTPIIVQGNVTDLVVYIETPAGAPATGLVYTDVTAALKKATDPAFNAFTLTAPTFTELSSGFYAISLDTVDTDVLGTLYLIITGGAVKTSVASAFVVVVAAATPTVVTPPSTVAIFGYVYGPDAVPAAGISVTAKILGAPTILRPGSDGILLSLGLVTAVTDSNGFFTVDLISGSTVDIFISESRYRRTFLVPGTSTNLFDIP